MQSEQGSRVVCCSFLIFSNIMSTLEGHVLAQEQRMLDVLAVRNAIANKGDNYSEAYWNVLSQYFSGQLSSHELTQRVTEILGQDNISLHNLLLRALLQSAESPPVHRAPIPQTDRQTVNLDSKNTDPSSLWYQGAVNSRLVRNPSTSTYEAMRCVNTRDIPTIDALKTRMQLLASPLGIQSIRDDAVVLVHTRLIAHLKDMLELGTGREPEDVMTLRRSRIALMTSVNPILVSLACKEKEEDVTMT